MKKYKIYTLNNPLTGEIKYVGVTTGALNTRLSQHIYNGKKGKNTIVSKWVKSLILKGLKPNIRLLEIVEENEDEQHWIQLSK